jgi:Reverse transcriptase (RNA-dependent DNA polymerase)
LGGFLPFAGTRSGDKVAPKPADLDIASRPQCEQLPTFVPVWISVTRACSGSAELDRHLTATGLFYIRFMDDILVLAPTRWKLRRAIRVVNEVLGALGLEKHPDKTFIGHIERGFDFLGYAFSRGALRVAQQTLNNHASRLHRLYERPKTTPTWAVCLDAYVTRWMRWCRSGLGGIPNAVEDLSATPPEKRQAQHSQRG